MLPLAETTTQTPTQTNTQTTTTTKALCEWVAEAAALTGGVAEAGGGMSKVHDILYQGAAIVPLRYGACVGHGTCYTGEDLPV